jgi:ATP-dependent Clp protease ATP-binding subunit ClpA
MFERFTDKARRAIVVAQDEARSMEHSFIKPEHLLLGLAKGDGLAATALSEAGLDYDVVREKVAGAIAPTPGAGQLDKVPFSPEAKKALELSLREALRLGHNYIGTEHVLLGLLRGAETEFSEVNEVIGGLAVQVRARVIELVSDASPRAPARSPALSDALERARQLAGAAPVTTGHLLTAVLADTESQASKALGGHGVTQGSLLAALAQVAVAGTSDAVPGAGFLEIKVGDVTTTIQDPDLAAAVRDLTADQLRAALRQAFGRGPGRRAG